ncbi:transporter substrate-binding domain-containing protein, partial [Rhodococcus erythropolis]|nr:transporter substrate-binding domain-containing protein [Rhodococcus erythropolis]
LVVLQQGQVDAISTDDTILAGLASQDPYLMMVGGSLGVEPYGIGVNKDNPDLVRFVNGTLERIRGDGTWNRIYDRWLSVLGPSPGPPPAVYRD